MDLSQVYGGSLLKAADLQGQSRKVTVSGVSLQDFPDQPTKIVLSFKNTDKQLVINKTNYGYLAGGMGTESDNWVGRTIELRPEKTHYKGELVDCIRTYPAQAQAAPAPAPQAPAPAPAAQAPAGFDDDLPF